LQEILIMKWYMYSLDDGKGEALESGTDGWQFYFEITPNKDEKLFEKNILVLFSKLKL
jgi:hypothetical protein